MSRIKFLLTALWMGISLSLSAQNAVLTGSVTDTTQNEPVSFASIALLKTGETSATAGGISDADGVFRIDRIPYGTYDVLVSFLGYESKRVTGISLSSRSATRNLGTIYLTPAQVQLDAVEVTGVTLTEDRKIDRTTYRVADFETARGGSALDILGKLPSVSVDPDGEIAVRGASDFVVYLNGKPTMMKASDLLSQIPGSQIESIDIITVPSSRYDAQGKGGIIHITTSRSALQGLSVALNMMAGGTPWTNDEDHFTGHQLNNNRLNAGASVVYNSGRLSVFGSMNIRNKNNKGIGQVGAFIFQDPGLGSASGYPEQYFILAGTGSRPKWDNNLSASGGIRYDISKRSSLSATYQYAHRESGRAAYYLYDAWYASTVEGEPSWSEPQLYNPNHINRTGTFSNFNVEFSTRPDEKSSLQTALILEQSALDQTITNKEYFYNPLFDQVDYAAAIPGFHSYQTDATPLQALRFEINYTRQLENGNSLEMGLQPQWVALDGQYRYDTIQADGQPGGFDHFNNTIDLKRNIYAAFADYSGSWDKLRFKLGLRLEYLNQEMQVESTAYFREVYDFFGTGRDYSETTFVQQKADLFPAVHLQYEADEKNIITLAGSRRINRPPAKNMSPFLYRRHQEIFELGDPLLSPEYILNGELSYERKLGRNNVVLTGFYRDVQDAIYRVNRLSYDYDANSGGVLLRSYTNSGDQIALGGELGVNLSMLKRLKVYVGGSLYRFSVEADDRLFGEQLSSTSTNWSMQGHVNWSVSQSLKINLDYLYDSPTVTPQGENYSNTMANLAVTYLPARWPNWNFSGRLLDLLGTNQTGGYTNAYYAGIRMFNRDWIYDYEGRIFELSAVYTLNMKGKKSAEKDPIGRAYF